MVSKLVLAAQEACVQAKAEEVEPQVLTGLLDCYRDLCAGLGTHKSVHEQGAFPADPYSHTPSMAGAQQPGLTGQVKEDFIARLVEFGIRVEDGCLRFDPFLLSDDEFLEQPREFAGQLLAAGSVGATFCGVPIVISKGDSAGVRVIRSDGTLTESDELQLDRNTSADVFKRSGSVKRIEVTVAPK